MIRRVGEHGRTGRRAPGFLLCLGVSLLVLPGCSSSTQLDSIELQLAEMQRALIQLQRQSATKQDISGLGTSVGDEAQRRLQAEADLRLEVSRLVSRLEALEAKLDNTQQSLSQLSQQIAATNQELKTLRAIQNAPPVGIGEGSRPPVPITDLDPGEVYDSARGDYQRGNYDLAILGFRQYLDRFPDTDRSDNALYWIGESYFSQRKFQQAIREFTNLQSRYPTSESLPSALLKKGYAHLELGENDQGEVQLRSLIQDFPRSDAALLARQTLENLGVDVGRSGP